MLAICDEGKSEEPIYYVWLNEALKEIQQSNPQWYRQETISIRIPSSNVLENSKIDEIENYDAKHRFSKKSMLQLVVY
jgi:hypothetical protein